MSMKAKTFLGISLLLNILLIGVVTGHMSGQKFKHGRFGPPEGEAFEKLSEDRKQVLRTHLKKQRENRKSFRTQMRANRQDVIEILTAPEFDTQAYEQKMQEIQTLRNQMIQSSSQATQELAETLSQEEREALAQNLRRHRKKKPHTK